MNLKWVPVDVIMYGEAHRWGDTIRGRVGKEKDNERERERERER